MTEYTKGDFKPVPEADYMVRMNRVEEKPCKNGKMVKASFQIVNGDHKNRLIFQNFLVEHTNPKAVEIGMDQLNKYLKAVGLENGLEDIGHDRTQLETYTEIPFIAHVKETAPQEYTAKDGSTKTAKAGNKIVGFSKR